jgi:membrane fusion protein, multidrug efflux system
MKQLTRTRLITIILVFAVLSFFIWWSTKPNTMEGKSRRQQTYTVKVIHPQVKDMPVTLQEVGSVEAEESVNVISQVAGTLRKIDITQGQMVTAGQLLFEIDPAFYKADLMQAQANLQRDQAQLAFLQATANRYAGLAKLEYVTRQQYDQAMAAVKEQEAVVVGDQAILEQKQIQLSYTQIRAPIAGKSGAISVHVGDLIPANGATPLLVINRLENVLVSFNIPQDRLNDLLTYQKAGTLKLQVLNEAGGKILAEGELAFVGNVVSPQTGTVQVKGEVSNRDLQLWPGQLVTVRLILTTESNALVIPSLSVQLGQKGKYVYVVRNNKAAIQPITVSRQVDSESVVSSGLQVSDSIIAEIPPGLQDGSKVQVSTPTPAPSPSGKKQK